MPRHDVSLAALTLALCAPLAASAAEQAVLVFTKTASFRHTSIPAGVRMLEALGTEHGYAIEHTEEGRVFDDDTLTGYAVVVFLSTTGDVLNDAEQAALERYVTGGGGFVGIHAAADTEHDWPWYGELVGTWFQSHPPVQAAAVDVVDREHPSTAHLPERWERIDEWYDYTSNPRARVHVLMTLDESSYRGGTQGDDHPIAWCHRVEQGRSWYTGLGHTEASYAEPAFRQHVLGGLQWAAGDVAGRCSPP